MFKCEEDSFLNQFNTTVESCERATIEWVSSTDTHHHHHKPKEIHGFNVICEDTILFPEGGGQPCDFGLMNGYPVRRVVRHNNKAIHFVETNQEFEVGSEVNQCLDWERRLDNMQQHSGQHLLTALFSQELNYETKAWWLGTDSSYVVLGTNNLVSRESLDLIERKINALIREGRSVSIKYFDPDDKTLETARIRGLPKNFTGKVRTVSIDGIEMNACCGTHVSNLSQLQCVKILYAEKSKTGVNVHFLFGERVIRRLGECFAREQQLNLALKGGPNQHLDLIHKLQTHLKAATKSIEKILKDLAIAEADKVNKLEKPLPKYYCLHRKDGVEPNFMHTFLRNAPEGIFYFLTVSENVPHGGKGHMMLRGDATVVEELGTLFIDILDGKGSGGSEGNFQGKFSDASRIPDCEAILEGFFTKPQADETTNR